MTFPGGKQKRQLVLIILSGNYIQNGTQGATELGKKCIRATVTLSCVGANLIGTIWRDVQCVLVQDGCGFPNSMALTNSTVDQSVCGPNQPTNQ